ncbi:MAG: type I glyceraldehyde-3-phosphate dehydrogenase [Candidatus Omnitrophica bacterium]|nr:type I glyceraldehyde-3-phosphate dehydrogenase [Candidatus Omnitrophota bacterium]
MARVAINGLGRIGRATLKIILERPELELAALNDLVPADNLAYLVQHDTVYGRYEKEVSYDNGNLCVDGKEYPLLNEKDPSNLPWKEMDIDVVFECTGVFTKKEDLEKHIKAGAKKAILSAPSKSPEVTNVVHGVNASGEGDEVFSCASCTTNCITPVVEVLSRRIGIKKAVMTTIHAYTSTQAIVDSPAKKWRRGRAAACNLVPTSTGAAKATTKVLTEFEGKFDGVAVRAPVPVGSVADMVFLTERPVTPEEVNSIFIEESGTERYTGVLGVAKIPVVSSDIVKDPRASIVDPDMTRVVDGDLLKVMSWYDNEWGYASQMVNEAIKG